MFNMRKGRPTALGCVFVLVCGFVMGWVLISSGVFASLFKPLVVLSVPGVSSSSAVIGQPSLSASFINDVLKRAHSPAAGTGQALYDLSVKYGVDDAYALAFFKHESEYGETGVARVTLSLGNIRCSLGYRCIDGYRAYATWQEGYADWFKLIKEGYITGQVSSKCPCVTVQQIIPVYAPASDHNNEAAYIAAVLSAVAAWRRGQVFV